MDKTVATVHIEVYENGTRITRDGSAFHIIAGLTRALARGSDGLQKGRRERRGSVRKRVRGVA
jgi:hypothetical protein